LDVLPSFTHFDFVQPGRRILVIGPMGSGKTEFSARVWRDAQVLLKKSAKAGVKKPLLGRRTGATFSSFAPSWMKVDFRIILRMLLPTGGALKAWEPPSRLYGTLLT
jgi:hypothetical protein